MLRLYGQFIKWNIKAIKLNSQTFSQLITTADLKKHAIVDHSVDDTYIATLALAAQKKIQSLLRRQLWPASYSLFADWFGDYQLELPYGNPTALTYIKYYDESNVLQTLDPATYQVDLNGECGRVALMPNASWPSIYIGKLSAIEVKWSCGYANAAAIPDEILLAIKMLVATWYNKREDTTEVDHKTVPHGIAALVADYKLQGFGTDEA